MYLYESPKVLGGGSPDNMDFKYLPNVCPLLVKHMGLICVVLVRMGLCNMWYQQKIIHLLGIYKVKYIAGNLFSLESNTDDRNLFLVQEIVHILIYVYKM